MRYVAEIFFTVSYEYYLANLLHTTLVGWLLKKLSVLISTLWKVPGSVFDLEVSDICQSRVGQMIGHCQTV